jgi:pentatricopeptide repeat protein
MILLIYSISMLKDIREMMLPDGLQALLEDFDDDMFNIDKASPDNELEAGGMPHFSEIGLKLAGEDSTGTITQSEMIAASGLGMDLVTDEQANEAVMLAASQGKKKFVTFMMNQMTRLHIPLLNSSLTCILDGFSRLGQHDDVEYFFDLAIESGVTPDSQSWSAYISAVAIGSGHASALRVLERVQRLGIQVSATAYTSVLQDLVDSNKNDEAFDFWMRIKEDGVVVDVSAYEVMMQQCTQTYQVERAFNYLDEMRGSKIDPSVTIFEELFKCCGSAPHWVNGYQDTIFDAMALMEGAELLPSQKIYDNIIQSFGQAGDAASAEFYFWEMRQKGIQQGASTYKNLFGALARYYFLF